LCSSLKDRTGFAAGADIGLAFDETGTMAQILPAVGFVEKFSYAKFIVPLIGILLVVILTMVLLDVTL
jgi:hypothetical protein